MTDASTRLAPLCPQHRCACIPAGLTDGAWRCGPCDLDQSQAIYDLRPALTLEALAQHYDKEAETFCSDGYPWQGMEDLVLFHREAALVLRRADERKGALS